MRLGAERADLVVLDADLASDCRVRAFELAYPDRFVECGIAEQDMVSTAAGLARHGLLPVVNSFASFLASRANEQIYNQASERTKVCTRSTTRASSRPGPASRTSRSATSRCSPRSRTDDRAAGDLGGDAGAPALGGRGSGGERRDPLAIGPSPRRIELAGRSRSAAARGARRRRRRSSPTAP